MLAAVRSATLIGVDGQPVTVEVHVSSGLPAYQVVGLPDTAVRESRERVRAAVLSSGLQWPMQRITVNLAPGGVRKTGSGLELAVALGVLGANEPLPSGVLDGVAVLGELGLDGSVRPVPGTLALVDALARAAGSSASWSRSPMLPRRRSWATCAVRRRAHLGELRCVPEGRGAAGPTGTRRAPTRPTTAGRRFDDEPRRPRRRPRPALRARRARGGGRGRASPPLLRTAGHGQDHAGPSPRHDPPAACRTRRRWRSPGSIGRG